MTSESSSTWQGRHVTGESGISADEAALLFSIGRKHPAAPQPTSNAYLVVVPIDADVGWANRMRVLAAVITGATKHGGVLDTPFVGWSQARVIAIDFEAVADPREHMYDWTLTKEVERPSLTATHRTSDMGSEQLSLLAKLERFGSLGHNWDHENGLPIPPEVLQEGERLLSSSVLSDYPPELFATGRGSIQFEYERDNGEYLEVEVFPHHFQVLVEKPVDTYRRFVANQWQEVADAIRAFHES